MSATTEDTMIVAGVDLSTLNNNELAILAETCQAMLADRGVRGPLKISFDAPEYCDESIVFMSVLQSAYVSFQASLSPGELQAAKTWFDAWVESKRGQR